MSAKHSGQVGITLADAFMISASGKALGLSRGKGAASPVYPCDAFHWNPVPTGQGLRLGRVLPSSRRRASIGAGRTRYGMVNVSVRMETSR